MKAAFIAIVASACCFFASCNEDEHSRVEKQAKEIVEAEKAKALARKMLAEEKAFKDVKYYVDSCRTLIPGCVESKDAECNCNTFLYIAEDSVQASGSYISIRSLDLFEPEKKLEHVELSMNSPDFGDCEGQIIKIDMDELLFASEKCAKLFEKYGIK